MHLCVFDIAIIICFSMLLVLKQKLLKTSKVAQKLPSTIGTGLVVEWPEVSDLRELYIPPVPFSYDFGFGFGFDFMITNIFLSLKSRNFGV